MSDGNTILMMDDEPEGVIPVKPAQLITPPVNFTSGGETVLDPIRQTPERASAFTEVIEKISPKDTNIPTPSSAASPAPTQPVVVAETPLIPDASTTPATAKPKMNRKKNIIIASMVGLAGIVGVAVAATFLRKGGGEDESVSGGDGLFGTSATGENLFGELSGTCMQGDELPFSQAFANARGELGANGIFKWRGQMYGTMLKDEWDGLSTEGRDQFSQQAQSISLENDFPDADVASDEAVAVMDADEIDPVEEGEPADDEIEEGEPADDEIEEDELVDDDQEYNFDDDEEYADYMNDEDPSDFV